MPSIQQLEVANQLLEMNGHENCGYHAFKNALLTLMHHQGLINETQFEAMLKDQALSKAVFDQVISNHAHDGSDLTLPVFMNLLARAKAGEFNFSTYGITQKHLMQLPLTPNGTQGITVANYVIYPDAPGHGLGGMEDDLLVASATVQLARSKGKTNHVFALGLNNKHWVTAAVSQNEQGVRSWQFMDSYKNQTLYKQTAIDKIEAILNQSETELQRYLRQAYFRSSDLFFRRYRSFFDANTGLPLTTKVDILKNGVLLNAKEYFIDQKENIEQFTLWIAHRFQFMKTAGWLTSKGEVEQIWLKQLYHMTKFIIENASATHPKDKQVKKQLEPIYKSLEGNLAQEKIVDVEPVVVKPVVNPVMAPKAEELELRKIRNNAFDIKSHFKLLFDTTLAKKASPKAVHLVDYLVNEQALLEELKKEYPRQDYVMMFYVHKPHSSAVSPVFPEEPNAHTSVLLCKVNNNKIEQVLNIDGYNFTDYVDILGERPGAAPNPHIQQRLVIQAKGEASGSKTPIQRASWYNMNCVLYSYTFIERILELFKEQPELMRNLFPADQREKISPDSLHLLEEGILAGLVNKYVKKVKDDYIYDDSLKDNHHNQLRNFLAEQYSLKCSAERFEAQALLKAKKPVTNDLHIDDNKYTIELPIIVPSQKIDTSEPIIETDPNAVQQQTAIDAVQNGTPKATEGFNNRLVKAIKGLIEYIKDTFIYLSQKLGLA